MPLLVTLLTIHCLQHLSKLESTTTPEQEHKSQLQRLRLTFQRRTHNWGHELKHKPVQLLGCKWITNVHGQEMSVTMSRTTSNGNFRQFQPPAVTYTDKPSTDPFMYHIAPDGFRQISFTEYSRHKFEKLFRHSSIDSVGKVKGCKAGRSIVAVDCFATSQDFAEFEILKTQLERCYWQNTTPAYRPKDRHVLKASQQQTFFRE